jgi:long-chain fatty acid transport protein
MIKKIFLVTIFVLLSAAAWGSGFGVFTQGANGLGQANAVVAHPTGPSSLYFNPALLNQVKGRQVEVGTTGIYADRSIDLDSGGSEDADNHWNFPSTFYYTHQANDTLTSGIGIFFPFGLSSKWDDDYEGRYIGTEGDVLTMNINPVLSVQVTDKLSLAAGFDLLYMDATLKNKLNQTAAYAIAYPQLSEFFPNLPLPGSVIFNDIDQEFNGDGWGAGYNLGVLYQLTERISLGATYRSHIDVDIQGDVNLDNVDPALAVLFPEGNADADIRLPAQAAAGIAVQALDQLIVEVGVRWEDWSSTDELKIEFDQPILGQSTNVIPRDWRSTWTYNVGGQFQINDTVALNAGYLYGQNAVPSDTFEPIIPDTDAHLFTVCTNLTFGPWTVSGAFGWEHHEDRDKTNTIGDPLGSAVASQIAGQPVTVGTANGEYQTDIYLVALSVGYAF